MSDEELNIRTELAKVRMEHDVAALQLEQVSRTLDRTAKRLEELTTRAQALGIRTAAHELYPEPVKLLKLGLDDLQIVN